MSNYDDDMEPGPSIEGEEFLQMMEERGLMIPRPPTPWQRFKRAAGAPFRLIGRGLAGIAWFAWGKRRHRKQIERDVKRMQQLAGIGPDAARDLYDTLARPQKTGYIGDAAAAEEHQRIIKTKIVKEPLPKPDFDDTGLN